ncbi:MAG: hypothetical protein HY698_20320 [Deltaproteobacteria bacterium]|nr:hypothetical protein [Deltaproteobacteria bacterium]
MDERLADLLRALELAERNPGGFRQEPAGGGSPSGNELAQGEWLAATGILAGQVAVDLAEPLARIRDGLASVVDTLDQHVASAKGPKPLPWNMVTSLRRKLADAFFDAGRVAKLAGDLAALASPPCGVKEEVLTAIDVNQVLERAVSLSLHRLTGDCEVFVNLGRLGRARGNEARLTQALTQLLVGAAQAARAAAGSNGTISVRTHEDVQAGEILVITEHAKRVESEQGFPFEELVRQAIEAQGGRLVVCHANGHARSEVRLPFAGDSG